MNDPVEDTIRSKGGSGRQFFLLFLLAIIITGMIFFRDDRGTASSTERARLTSKMLRVGDVWRSTGPTFGCATRDDLFRFAKLAQDDAVATLRMLSDREGPRKCSLLPEGTVITIEDAGDSKFPCVRAQGDPYCRFVLFDDAFQFVRPPER